VIWNARPTASPTQGKLGARLRGGPPPSRAPSSTDAVMSPGLVTMDPPSPARSTSRPSPRGPPAGPRTSAGTRGSHEDHGLGAGAARFDVGRAAGQTRARSGRVPGEDRRSRLVEGPIGGWDGRGAGRRRPWPGGRRARASRCGSSRSRRRARGRRRRILRRPRWSRARRAGAGASPVPGPRSASPPRGGSRAPAEWGGAARACARPRPGARRASPPGSRSLRRAVLAYLDAADRFGTAARGRDVDQDRGEPRVPGGRGGPHRPLQQEPRGGDF
jgi:hypothetical protein